MSLIASDTQRIVVGLGVTGLSCARFLAKNGMSFSVADNREIPPGLDQFRQEFPDVTLSLGPFQAGQFDAADELYISPGISLREPVIASAIQAGVKISGDLDLFVQSARAPLVAITGSNGKSTVTTLLGAMAEEAGLKVAIGGNLGTPMLDLLSDDSELYVLELSSFQLERCAGVNAEVATVLNVSEDHLDHHGSLLAYHQAKHRIFRGCRQALINRDDMLTHPLVPDSVRQWSFGLQAPGREAFGLRDEAGAVWLCFGDEKLIAADEIHLAGRHNLANALAALALGKAAGLEMASMLSALRKFKGLPHRCQHVADVDGVAYYNDSKGTNVGAAVASLRGLGDRFQVVLLAGGQAKGADLEPLVETLQEVGRAAVFFGESAPVLSEYLGEGLPSQCVSGMDEAVLAASRFAQSGDAVLLSPACASFDMFRNYEHRGECFVDAVGRLAQGRLQ
ncbi:UDP-N-acetylmuramoylalanine--D-glutamate ligase [Litorivivens lipolytica]|uniref:UDP-N-acetylmuramoylalanine--D-glutamate ligase n=1 Tax=Litorivivens lipolytica TaxID=1524264 RepID=A0A7W4W464_9GAMM|nr:UDP-N-acetylmuramoyl-L-alanine--D-glutamate ligase [Litorivivens lipolytica]MBB3047079.1 UDP-N-acetylmuramoylalanine--D-glutamate ligase [Litorivivens lipolytica]